MTRRTCLLLLLASLAWGVAAPSQPSTPSRMTRGGAERVSVPGADCASAGSPVRSRRATLVGAGDKPFGPVAVVLQAGEETSHGQAVHVSLRPVRELDAVTWRWELTGGALLMAGDVSGSADPTAGAVSELEAVLLPPGGGAAGEATLVVEARFEGAGGAGGPQTTVQQQTLRWGEVPDSPVPVVQARDAESGELVPFAVVPSVHGEGR